MKAKFGLLFVVLLCSQPSNAQQSETAKAAATAPPDSSVETFFQTSPTQSVSAHSSTVKTNDTLAHRLYKCLWHVLDNAGIPVFTGRDSDLDPSIHTGAQPAPPKLTGRDIAPKEPNNIAPAVSQVASKQAAVAARSAPPKIPESELEGTIYDSPATQDVQKTAR